MYTKEDYKQIATEMIVRDAERDRKFIEIDNMHNVKWEMPKEWENTGWIRKYPSTKPADALDTAIRALSTKEPRLSIMPILPNLKTVESFEKIERTLLWAWKQIGKRGQLNPTRAIVTSAIKYDEITAQLIHIPTHNKAVKEMGGNGAYSGDFQLIVHNPRNVHVQYSDYGFESVVLCKRQPLHKIVNFWGKNANGLKELVDGKKKGAMNTMLKVYDYWDNEVRYVWVEGDESGGVEFDLLGPVEHKLGFIPWTCRIGGSNLEDLVENQRRPLMNSVISANTWHTQNLFRSLMLSLTMARAAEPTILSKTPTRDGVDVDATEGMGQIKLGPGEEAQKLPPSEIGQSIQNMYQMLGGEMETSAGISLLQMNSIPSGMAFATYNALMQSAMGSINPYKAVSELAIADVFCLMSEWVRYSVGSLIGYDDRQTNVTKGLKTWGTMDVVTADMLPERQDMNIEVKLTEYIPTDEMGKINAMVMLIKNANYPIKRALETLDINDPKMALEEWAEEQLSQATVMEQIKDLQFDNELLRQQKRLEVQQKQTQARQAQMQQQSQPTGSPQEVMGDQQMIAPEMGADMANMPFEQTQGQGFAGNFGGTTPVSASGGDLAQLEGADYRGLRMPPEGRAARR